MLLEARQRNAICLTHYALELLFVFLPLFWVSFLPLYCCFELCTLCNISIICSEEVSLCLASLILKYRYPALVFDPGFGCFVVLQIRRSLLNEDEYGFRRARRPIYYDEGLEVC